jgi:hypothetical protein
MSTRIPKNICKRGDFIIWKDSDGLHNVRRSDILNVYIGESTLYDYAVYIDTISTERAWTIKCLGDASFNAADRLDIARHIESAFAYALLAKEENKDCPCLGNPLID